MRKRLSIGYAIFPIAVALIVTAKLSWNIVCDIPDQTPLGEGVIISTASGMIQKLWLSMMHSAKKALRAQKETFMIVFLCNIITMGAQNSAGSRYPRNHGTEAIPTERAIAARQPHNTNRIFLERMYCI